MKKLMIITAVWMLFIAAAGPACADETEDKIELLRSIIRSSIETNDYNRISEALDSLDDVDTLAWQNEDIAYFKAELLKAAEKAGNTADPMVLGVLLDEALRVFPNDFRLSVKLLKSYLELGQVREASDLDAELVARYGQKKDDPEFEVADSANKAVGLMLDKQYDQAKAGFEAAIAKDPEWTGGYFLMSALLTSSVHP